MTDPTYRNHPSVIAKNIIAAGILLLVFTFGMMDSFAMKAGVAILFALICAFTVLYWARTTIKFGDNEAVVNSNVLYKKKKTIPYKKIATVNVVRDIYNRIFGTTTLSININSSRNAEIPEARFVFKAALAEEIKERLTSDIFGDTEAEESAPVESFAGFSIRDSILHGIFGSSTYLLIYASGLLAFSVFSALFLEGNGIVAAVGLLVVGEVIPVTFKVLKYGNFKIYRINDQIHLQHGIVQNYVSKFDVDRINAIRIRKPLFGRIIGKSYLEAEVVGINAVADDTTPLLCILADDKIIERLIGEILPEFVNRPVMMKQPKEARVPVFSKAAMGSIVTLIAAAYPCFMMYSAGEADLAGLTSAEAILYRYVPLAATAAAMILMFVGAHLSLKIREFGPGTAMFNLVNGIVDREILTIQYDRVQITEVSAGPLPRRLGLARCSISLLSSNGHKNIRTGYFDAGELHGIEETMLRRLRDGTYVYERNSI